MCLSVYLAMYLHIYLRSVVCLSVHSSVCLFVYLFNHLSINLSIYLVIYPSTDLPVCLFTIYMFMCLLYLFTHILTHLPPTPILPIILLLCGSIGQREWLPLIFGFLYPVYWNLVGLFVRGKNPSQDSYLNKTSQARDKTCFVATRRIRSHVPPFQQ